MHYNFGKIQDYKNEYIMKELKIELDYAIISRKLDKP